MHQRPEWFVVNLALAKLGWEHIAISWRLTEAERVPMIRECGAPIVVTDEADAGALAASLGAGFQVITVGAGHPGAVPLASLLSGDPAPPRLSRRAAPFVKYSAPVRATRRAAPATCSTGTFPNARSR